MAAATAPISCPPDTWTLLAAIDSGTGAISNLHSTARLYVARSTASPVAGVVGHPLEPGKTANFDASSSHGVWGRGLRETVEVQVTVDG